VARPTFCGVQLLQSLIKLSWENTMYRTTLPVLPKDFLPRRWLGKGSRAACRSRLWTDAGRRCWRTSRMDSTSGCALRSMRSDRTQSKSTSLVRSAVLSVIINGPFRHAHCGYYYRYICPLPTTAQDSGAGTNLKVGWGHTSRNFFSFPSSFLP